MQILSNNSNTFSNEKCYSFVRRFRGRTELGDVTVHNIKQLKRVNRVVFPVSYNDKFYKDVLEVGELAKLGTKEGVRSHLVWEDKICLN